MFKNTYQNGLLSIFFSCGSCPLAIWDMEVRNGHIKRVTDTEVNSIVLEIVSTNVATTYISCPKNNQVLGIKLPFLVMIVKNLKRYFSFEITILDDKNMRRRFRISNFQSTTKIKPFCTSMPIGLSGGWNQIQFNLADFTRRAYGTQFIETLRVQVHANTRLRRIYFSERLYSEEELPQEYKLYLPLDKKQKKGKVDKKETAPPAKAASLTPLPVAEAPPPPTAPQGAEMVKDEPQSKKSDATVTPATPVEEEKPPEPELKAPEPEPAEISAAPTEEIVETPKTVGSEATDVPEGMEITEVADVADVTEVSEVPAAEPASEEPPAAEAPPPGE